jgi:HrpA-like RNA helicase
VLSGESYDQTSHQSRSLSPHTTLIIRTLNKDPSYQESTQALLITIHKYLLYNLPILKYRDEIVKTIRKNTVVIINGQTGCGKTTKVPQFILDDALARNQNCKILVAQPRKIAAITVAQRVAKERKVMLGSAVGYQVGLDKKLDRTNFMTKILFCTMGVILQKIIHEQHPKKSFYKP